MFKVKLPWQPHAVLFRQQHRYPVDKKRCEGCMAAVYVTGIEGSDRCHISASKKLSSHSPGVWTQPSRNSVQESMRGKTFGEAFRQIPTSVQPTLPTSAR
jgi:hypothetical protein